MKNLEICRVQTPTAKKTSLNYYDFLSKGIMDLGSEEIIVMSE